MRILLAEDDPMAALVLRKVLLKHEHHCVVAKDGLVALEALGQQTFDMVISDWQMPRMDGVELCREVRAQPKLSALYFVIVTTRSERGRFSEALASGADDYLLKPVSTESLGAMLGSAARLLALRRTLHEGTAALKGLSSAPGKSDET